MYAVAQFLITEQFRPRTHTIAYISSGRVVRRVETNCRVSTYVSFPKLYVCSTYISLGPTIISAYTLAFQTHLFSVLPPSFSRGIKTLVSATLQRIISQAQDPQDRVLWQAFDTLSLIDRYETLIASIGYEIIESHVKETCAKKWAEPMLGTLRTWMIDKIVPWMLYPFARGATNGDLSSVVRSPAATDSHSADEAKTMMQGVGSRFDFHMHKTLCTLR